MERISFEKLVLPNGLQVIFHQDRSLPIVSVNVWYHVGSKDEVPGRTGLAHLFELCFACSQFSLQAFDITTVGIAIAFARFYLRLIVFRILRYAGGQPLCLCRF